ncbi:DUF5685 family protein [Anaerocolumna aminovalerica]|jgi:hypothetical protein|uniref:Uncharacterized protein n=1 Tax=Anaerocolumna aminovalerica TaxID=1527 RepID=A0A1I5CJU5_9FIRM|nr:DUF5685 family protein [Anaerocolumna aminovalerica]MBU5332618.1 hypothetical protein [Anaerocolumna aminovalerica]MDU6264984.1 DUF5685 family protein [Anaerocolumna aminovalerica]SFN87183.1 hypothetical protein SAMN04489757_103105 [Anaerocolumna aminovalerica]
MFGYVNIYKPELKMKDFYKYKAYYCGLCKTLKDKYGSFGQMTLTYDMTFLIILLTSLYESNTEHEIHRCIVHPVKKHDTLCNEITDYAADMNIVLSYYHLLDNWQDDRSIAGFTGTKLLNKKFKMICNKYPRQCQAISNSLNLLKECEQNNDQNIDLVSRCFGELMSELFVYKQDMWEPTLKKFGFFLGKYIYVIDAYEDLEEDIKKGRYNPLKSAFQKDTYETECKNILNIMIAECTGEFEKLPCLLDGDILRNILYEGVWTKFNSIQKKKSEVIQK